MRLVLNSDVLFHTGIIREQLGGSLGQLLAECAKKGVVIVVPSTTLMEFACKQGVLAERKRNELKSAASNLVAFDVDVGDFDPEQLVPVPNLIDLIRASGPVAEVAEPRLEHYQDAHNRACFHLPPDKPASEANRKDRDEMRDLVIWSVALSIATENGGAILLSNDSVHKGGADLPEAREAGLVVLDGPEAAISWLNDKSFPYVRKLAERCLEVIVSADTPGFNENLTVGAINVDDVEMQPDDGEARIRFGFTAAGDESEPRTINVIAFLDTPTSATVEITIYRDELSISLNPQVIADLEHFTAASLLTTFGGD